MSRPFARTLRAIRIAAAVLTVCAAAALVGHISRSDAVWLYGPEVAGAAATVALLALHPAIVLLTTQRRPALPPQVRRVAVPQHAAISPAVRGDRGRPVAGVRGAHHKPARPRHNPVRRRGRAVQLPPRPRVSPQLSYVPGRAAVPGGVR